MTNMASSPELDDDDKEVIASGNCPDCFYRGFVLGPKGGSSINIECGNLACRSRFNITSLFDPGRGMIVIFCQRIPSEDDGGADWTAIQQTIG